MTQLKLAFLFVCLIAIAIANPSALLDDPLEDDSFENPAVGRIERGNEDNFEDDELDNSMTDLEREVRDQGEDFDETDEEDDFNEELERQDRAEPQCKKVRVSPNCRCRGEKVKHGLIVSLKTWKAVLSEKCKENRTFGLTWNNRRVWIKKRCNANFWICYLPFKRRKSKSGRLHKIYGKVKCHIYKVKPCPSSMKCRKWFMWNSITSYQMTKEFSKGVCKKDNTFGTDHRKSAVWVNGGCDAEFNVCYKPHHPFIRKLRKHMRKNKF